MVKPKGQNRRERRDQLLQAADGLLAEGGYAALTAQAVADRAGLNKALVFYYFGSTHELFEQALQGYFDRHRRALAEAAAAEGSLRDRVHRLVDAFIDSVEENPAYARVVQNQLSSQGPHLPLMRRHLNAVLRPIEELLGAATRRSGPLAARQFHVTLSAIVTQYFTMAPAIGKRGWGRDPLSKPALAERRAHVHWIVDACLDRLLGASKA